MADPAQSSSTPWIRTSDFAETSIWLSVVNNTTRVPVPKNFELEVSEIAEHGLILKMPPRSCSDGHLLSIHLERRRKNPLEKLGPNNPIKEDAIDVTAKVIELDPLGKDWVMVTVKFYQL